MDCRESLVPSGIYLGQILLGMCHPIIAYLVANHRTYLCHFWANVICLATFSLYASTL